MKKLMMVLWISFSVSIFAGCPKDSVAIRNTVIGHYIGAWYAGDADAMAKGLHPLLSKRKVDDYDHIKEATVEGLVDAAQKGYGTKIPKDKRRTDFWVLDKYGNMAAARALATNFYDCVHVVKVDSMWKIINVLWHGYQNETPGSEEDLQKMGETFIQGVLNKDSLTVAKIAHPRMALTRWCDCGKAASVSCSRFMNEMSKSKCRKESDRPCDGKFKVEVLDIYEHSGTLKMIWPGGMGYGHASYCDSSWVMINALYSPTKASCADQTKCKKVCKD